MKKQPTARLTDGEPGRTSSVVKEISTVPGLGETITVRSAKAHLSGLLDRVVRGHKVVITSGGRPKARLVPMDEESNWKPFTGTWEHLKTMPPWRGGKTADELIREDRDARG
jgi:prevent-host-death family protein